MLLLCDFPGNALAHGKKVRMWAKVPRSSRREHEDDLGFVVSVLNTVYELVLARSRPLHEHEELLVEIGLPGNLLRLGFSEDRCERIPSFNHSGLRATKTG